MGEEKELEVLLSHYANQGTTGLQSSYYVREVNVFIF